MSNHDAQVFNWHYDGGAIDDESLEIHGRKFFFFLVLFVIVLFTIVFFLYVRWICRPQTFSSFRRRHALQTPPSSQGLAAETIKKLPIVLHQTRSGQDSACECCICLSAFRDDEKRPSSSSSRVLTSEVSRWKKKRMRRLKRKRRKMRQRSK
ncbi:hypothetical protein Lal_00048639 [Lupinus albus]|nr:hypothetical protein Lal_00048639 [Lupinus albus]